MCSIEQAEEIGNKLEKKLEVKIEKLISCNMLELMPQAIAKGIREAGAHLEISDEAKRRTSALETSLQKLTDIVNNFIQLSETRAKENEAFHKVQDEIHEKTVPAMEKMTVVLAEVKAAVSEIIPTYKAMEAEKNRYKNVKDWFAGTGKAIVQISVILIALGVIISVLSGFIYFITNFDHIFKN